MEHFKTFFGAERNNPTTVADFDAIHNEYKKEEHYYPTNFKRINLLILAYHNDKPVAWTGINQQTGHWYVRGVYVLPEYRGNGLQNKMAAIGFDLLREKGVKQVTTLVDVNNEFSKINMLKQGFVKTGKRKNNYHYKKIFDA